MRTWIVIALLVLGASATSALAQQYFPNVKYAQNTASSSLVVARPNGGNLITVSGSAANASYIMVFDATAAPSNGAVSPLKCWGPMLAAGPFVFSWALGPVFTVKNGIVIASSSTGCATMTATNATSLSVEYQ